MSCSVRRASTPEPQSVSPICPVGPRSRSMPSLQSGDAMTQPIVSMSAIRKQFGSVLANDDVTLTIQRGEVLALLGENGAGKRTLMKILYGFQAPAAVTIGVDGRPVPITSRSAAKALRI